MRTAQKYLSSTRNNNNSLNTNSTVAVISNEGAAAGHLEEFWISRGRKLNFKNHYGS